MNDKAKAVKLSKDEAGKLKGGFSVQSIEVQNSLFASNGNCLGGGWGDTNTNCTGTCSGCSINQQPGTSTGTGSTTIRK